MSASIQKRASLLEGCVREHVGNDHRDDVKVEAHASSGGDEIGRLTLHIVSRHVCGIVSPQRNQPVCGVAARELFRLSCEEHGYR